MCTHQISVAKIRSEFGALIWARKADEERVDASKICLDFEVHIVKVHKRSTFIYSNLHHKSNLNFRILKYFWSARRPRSFSVIRI